MKKIWGYLPLLLFCLPLANAQSAVDFNVAFGSAFDSATGNIGQTTVAVRLPPRTAVFDVSPAGEFIGVHKLSENFSAPELEIVTEWFRELRTRVPASN